MPIVALRFIRFFDALQRSVVIGRNKLLIPAVLSCAILLMSVGYIQLKKSKNVTTHNVQYVDFDESMQTVQFPHIVSREDSQYLLNFFKQLYEKNNLKQVKPQETPKIPKLIHVMWLGGKLPEEYQPYVQSWYDYHPDWTIIFWTDNAANYDRGTTVVKSFDELEKLLTSVGDNKKRIVVDTVDLQFGNRPFYDKAINYGEKSDILKWEIVYQLGGVYVDIDFECLRPLDLFHHTYDFYTGIQPLDTNMVQLGAALYGAIPKHPILERCVRYIAHNQYIQQIVVKTGPIHFTRSFLATAGRDGFVDIALPSSYFYPCGYEQRGTEKTNWCKTESCAVHHWAGSWLKPEAFVRT